MEYIPSFDGLHQVDFESDGFEWIDCHDSSQSALSYVRKDRSGAIASLTLRADGH